MAQCMLSLANGERDVLCEEEFCLFWRAVDQLGVAQSDWSGCAIQHFALLDGGQEIAAWLMSAKERVAADALQHAMGDTVSGDDEGTTPPAGCVLLEEVDPR
ncbi:MAG TPA: hypothetical protein VIK85_00790 [Coriobacteriia bacterium]